jgi:hypothetical protein
MDAPRSILRHYTARLLAVASAEARAEAMNVLDRAIDLIPGSALIDLVEVVSDAEVVAVLRTGARDGPSEDNVARHEGDYWTIVYSRTVTRLKSTKGLRDIFRLLSSIGEPVRATTLDARICEREVETIEPRIAERARKATTWRIRNEIARIERAHPALGRHLRHSIRTGRVCVYQPDDPVAWTIEPRGAERFRKRNGS